MLKNWVGNASYTNSSFTTHRSSLIRLVSALNLSMQKYDKFVRKTER